MREDLLGAIKDNEQLFHEICEKDTRINELETAEKVLKIKFEQSTENCKALTGEMSVMFDELVANKEQVKKLQEKLESNVVRISLPLVTISATVLVSMYILRGKH